MGVIRDRIEKGFAQFAHAIYRNRIKTIFLVFLVTAVVVSQIPEITIDTSILRTGLRGRRRWPV
jgi:hypothetical protein